MSRNFKAIGGLPKDEAVAECRPSKKELKARLKRKQELLDTFVSISNELGIDWETKERVIGRAYLDIAYLQDDLDRLKHG